MVFNVVGMLAKLIFMFSQAQDFSSVFVFCFCISYGSFTLCNALYVNFEVLEKFAKNKMQMRKDEAEGTGTAVTDSLGRAGGAGCRAHSGGTAGARRACVQEKGLNKFLDKGKLGCCALCMIKHVL